MTNGIILMAAGQSKRMGKANKLLTLWKGKPLLAHSLEAIKKSHFDETVIVLGHEAQEVKRFVQTHITSATFINNVDFAEGMGTSLRCGALAIPAYWKTALVMLGDMPLITARHLDQMLETAIEWCVQYPVDLEQVLAIATHNEKRGNPVLFGRSWFPHLQALEGDQGARKIVKTAPSPLFVEIGPAALYDCDTPTAFK